MKFKDSYAFASYIYNITLERFYENEDLCYSIIFEKITTDDDSNKKTISLSKEEMTLLCGLLKQIEEAPIRVMPRPPAKHEIRKYQVCDKHGFKIEALDQGSLIDVYISDAYAEIKIDMNQSLISLLRLEIETFFDIKPQEESGDNSAQSN